MITKEIKILDGMIVAGYTVLVIGSTYEPIKPSVMYGLFKTVEDANKWAGMMEGIVSIHPIYEPTTSRG